MRMSQKSRNGIVLITTMLTVVLVVMLVSAVVFSNIGSLRQTSLFYTYEEALMAANSGVQYAMTRLQNDVTWRACDTYATSEKSGCKIEEGSGNVVGRIVSPNGQVSFFRIKFNCEDGPGGIDGMNNSGKTVKSSYVSVNNLYNSTPAKVYTADADGTVKYDIKEDAYKTKHIVPESGSYPLAKSTCCLIVEGFAGRGVRDLDTDDILALHYEQGRWRTEGEKGRFMSVLSGRGLGSDTGSGEIAHRVVESYVTSSDDSRITDAAAAAAGNLVINTGSLEISGTNGISSPTLRSLRSLNVGYDSLQFESGNVYAGVGYEHNTKFASNSGETSKNVKINYTDDTSRFAALNWDDVPDAEHDSKLKGSPIDPGTYVWSKGKDGKNRLYRLPGSYPPDDSHKTISADTIKNEGTEITETTKGNLEIDFAECTIKVNGNAYVKNSGSSNNFIIRNDGAENAVRPIVAFISDSSSKAPVLTSNYGNIYIQGATLGAGSITCQKDISLQGPSILESEPGVGVSVYSQQDVNITPITEATQTVQNERPAQTVNPELGGGECATKEVEYRPINQAAADTNRKNIIEAAIADIRHLSSYKTQYGPWETSYECTVRAIVEEHVDRVIADAMKNGDIPAGKETWTKNDPSHVTQPPTDKIKEAIDRVLDGQYVTGGDPVPTALAKAFNRTTLEPVPVKDNKENTLVIQDSDLTDAQKFIPNDLATENYRDNKTSQLSKLLERYKKLHYSDQDIAGVIYAWHNINVDVGTGSTLNLTGAMVAYGQNPNTKRPASSGDANGNIKLRAGNIALTADPNYMTMLLNAASGRKLKIAMYSVF